MKSYKKQTELQRIAGLQNWNLANLKGMEIRLKTIAKGGLGISVEVDIEIQRIIDGMKIVYQLLKEDYSIHRKGKRNERSN